MGVEMNTKPTLYFDHGGPQSTQAALEAAKTRALDIKPEAVIVTSSSGETALQAARIFEGTGIRIIGVPFQKHLWGRYRPLEPQYADPCRQLGVTFLPDEPALQLIDDLQPDIVNAWRIVSQGFKVALQVASMCVELGMLEPGAHVISLGGSSRGADTAVALHAYGHANLFDCKVTDVICMPAAAAT
jgi:hypothetical protein